MRQPTGESEKAPVGFKVFLVAAALYLILRMVQMGGWLMERLG